MGGAWLWETQRAGCRGRRTLPGNYSGDPRGGRVAGLYGRYRGIRSVVVVSSRGHGCGMRRMRSWLGLSGQLSVGTKGRGDSRKGGQAIWSGGVWGVQGAGSVLPATHLAAYTPHAARLRNSGAERGLESRTAVRPVQGLQWGGEGGPPDPDPEHDLLHSMLD